MLLAASTTQLLFLCTPYHPPGKTLPLSMIEEFCNRFKGIVIVDEAYIDFCNIASAITLLNKYPNLFVLQTLSKAYGMAGLRLGMAFASTDIINVLNKVKPPYNISCMSQATALEVLNNQPKTKEEVKLLKNEREKLFEYLTESGLFENIYPSDANFILVTTPDYMNIYNFLLKNKVVVRKRDIPPLIANGLRISVGTPDENVKLIELLKEYKTNFKIG